METGWVFGCCATEGGVGARARFNPINLWLHLHTKPLSLSSTFTISFFLIFQEERERESERRTESMCRLRKFK